MQKENIHITQIAKTISNTSVSLLVKQLKQYSKVAENLSSPIISFNKAKENNNFPTPHQAFVFNMSNIKIDISSGVERLRKSWLWKDKFGKIGIIIDFKYWKSHLRF